MILALDSSTSTTGYAFNENGVIVDAGWIDTRIAKDNRQRLSLVEKGLHERSRMDRLEKVVIESAVSGFSQGFTSAQTIISLAKWNSLLEYHMGNLVGPEKIELISALHARKKVFGKARIKGMQPKAFVREYLSKQMDITPFLKKNKLGNEDKRVSDTLDAIVLSLSMK